MCLLVANYLFTERIKAGADRQQSAQGALRIDRSEVGRTARPRCRSFELTYSQ